MRVFGVNARRTARLSRFQRLSGKDNDGGHRLSCVGGGVRFGCGFFKNPLLIVTSGIMYVLSSISVILQVLYYKLTKNGYFLWLRSIITWR